MAAPLLDTFKSESIGPSSIGPSVGIDDESSVDPKGIVHSYDYTCFQFTATDENGNTVARKLVDDEMTDFLLKPTKFFQSVFTIESNHLMLSVSLGRIVDGKYKAFSDAVVVNLSTRDNPPKS